MPTTSLPPWWDSTNNTIKRPTLNYTLANASSLPVIAHIRLLILLMIELLQRNSKCWQLHWCNHLTTKSLTFLPSWSEYSISRPNPLHFYELEITCVNIPLISSAEFPHPHHNETHIMLCTCRTWLRRAWCHLPVIATIGPIILLMSKLHQKQQEMLAISLLELSHRQPEGTYPALCTTK